VSVFAVSAWTPSAQESRAPATTKASRGASASTAANSVEAAITQLERDWATAIVKKDATALNRLLADEFNGTSPTAHTFPKTAAVEELKSGKYVVESMVLDEISVNVYGDVAVAFTSQKEKSSTRARTPAGTTTSRTFGPKKAADGRWWRPTGRASTKDIRKAVGDGVCRTARPRQGRP
jgi:ketosteroid isomerase-like protein